MEQWLDEWQPLFTAIGALLSVVSVGYLIVLFSGFKSLSDERVAAKESQLELRDERIKAASEDAERVERDLRAEIEALKVRIEAMATSGGRTLAETAFSGPLTAAESGLPVLLEELSNSVRELAQLHAPVLAEPDDYLELARGFLRTRAWVEAVEPLRTYVGLVPDDYDGWFSLGIAAMNARGGRAFDAEALVGYSNALARFPPDGSERFRAQLLSYRAAALKRLGRLGEAQCDARLARELAHDVGAEAEELDATYNLACIYGLQGDVDRLLPLLGALRDTSYEFAVLGKLQTYFAPVCDDDRFRTALGIPLA